MMKPDQNGAGVRRGVLWRRWLTGLCLLLILAVPVFGETDPGKGDNAASLSSQLDQAITAAQSDLSALETDLAAETRLLQEDHRRKEGEQSRMAVVKNLLIMSSPGMPVLEKAREEVEVSLSVIQSRLQTIQNRKDRFRQRLASVAEKQALLSQSIEETGGNPDMTTEILKKYGIYSALLMKEQAILDAMLAVLSRQTEINDSLSAGFEEIHTQIVTLIQDKKTGLLFQRTDRQQLLWGMSGMGQAVAHGIQTVAQWGQPGHWRREWQRLSRQAGVSDMVLLAGMVIGLAALFKVRSAIDRRPGFQALIQRRTGYPLALIHSCLALAIWIGMAQLLAISRIYPLAPNLIQFFSSFLTVILLTRITVEALRRVPDENATGLLTLVFQWQPQWIRWIRIYAFVYLFIARFISFQSGLLGLLRLVGELVLVLFIFLFFKDARRITPRIRHLRTATSVCQAAVMVGMLADAAGYTYIAIHWYLSWGITIAIVCVALLLVHSMKDVDALFRQALEPETGSARGISYPFYWIVSNGIYLVIAVLVLMGLLVTWGAGDRVFPVLWQVFTRQYTLGKIQLSLSSLFFAFLVILGTYAAARLWKQVMSERVLLKSGLSTGARESVVTLTGYGVWAVGILLSLSVFGMNTTSLAVVFGALSIGLGFGLQNIFNNFISGLILLFERPIQVGDVVELSGIWGEVQKINVRSTLVQTYDNSTMIIPNSEFISSRVTNWSHKDPYIRRDINVGVAYGSDTALVEKLLFQAAGAVREVSQYPRKPQVQFIDFGQSSLDFRLRFWSTIDDFLTAETRLRFEIDRLFREHRVVIPFPQRDVHLVAPDTPREGSGH